jgi:hypothetical protein
MFDSKPAREALSLELYKWWNFGLRLLNGQCEVNGKIIGI